MSYPKPVLKDFIKKLARVQVPGRSNTRMIFGGKVLWNETLLDLSLQLSLCETGSLPP